MDIFGGFFAFLTLFFVVIPIIGIILLIRYVIKKSKADQPAYVLKKEKQELITKTRAKKKKLDEWKPEYLEKLSNQMDFSYSKGFTRRFNGIINSLDGDRLIAYRRIDRGNFKNTARIMAISKSFEVYISQDQEEVTFYFNDKLLGKLVNSTKLYDDLNREVGKLNGRLNNDVYYTAEINNEALAYIVKNTERRMFLKNPFYRYRPTSGLETDPFWDNEVSLSQTLKLYRELNPDEYKWILCIALYELIYYGIDFTQ